MNCLFPFNYYKIEIIKLFLPIVINCGELGKTCDGSGSFGKISSKNFI